MSRQKIDVCVLECVNAQDLAGKIVSALSEGYQLHGNTNMAVTVDMNNKPIVFYSQVMLRVVDVGKIQPISLASGPPQ